MTALHILQTQGEHHARGMCNLRETLLLGALKWNVRMCLRKGLPVDDSLQEAFQIRLHPAEQTSSLGRRQSGRLNPTYPPGTFP